LGEDKEVLTGTGSEVFLFPAKEINFGRVKKWGLFDFGSYFDLSIVPEK
jgi:hypothetical protein